MTPELPYAQEVVEAAERVGLLVLDVDGVLTDGRIQLAPDGAVSKRFDIRDGHLIVLMRRHLDFPVAVLSGRDDPVTEHRARDLGIELVRQGVREKVPEARALAEAAGCSLAETAYVGDDLNDVPLLHEVGLGVAPADAAPEARAAARVVSDYGGGRGAVREVAELILKAKAQWQTLLDKMG